MRLLATILIGFFFGVTLSRVGFTSWDEVHHMFAFSDLRLTLTFVAAIAVLAISWVTIRKLSSPNWPPRNVHRGSALGGLLFGIGWSLCGACPSIAFVQLGEGQLGALYTIGGIFAGNWLYAIVHRRYLRWDNQSCLSD